MANAAFSLHWCARWPVLPHLKHVCSLTSGFGQSRVLCSPWQLAHLWILAVIAAAVLGGVGSRSRIALTLALTLALGLGLKFLPIASTRSRDSDGMAAIWTNCSPVKHASTLVPSPASSSSCSSCSPSSIVDQGVGSTRCATPLFNPPCSSRKVISSWHAAFNASYVGAYLRASIMLAGVLRGNILRAIVTFSSSGMARPPHAWNRRTCLSQLSKASAT